MAESFTGTVNTNNEFVTVENATGVTFTSGNTYTIQIKDFCTLKLYDAEFDLDHEKLQYKAGGEDLYIKTSSLGCGIAILEEE